ncbi:MAG: hypothetical protein RIG61_04320 [Deltaproteobacteria bacterium]
MNYYDTTSTSNAALINNNDGLNDGDLVRLIIKNKDESAFKSLVNRYASRMYYLVLTFTFNHQLSKKVTEDVFHSVNALDTDYTPPVFKTWLFTRAINISRKHLKDSEATHKGQLIDKVNERQGRTFPEKRFDIKEHGLFYNVNHNSSEFIPIIEKALYELPAPYRVAVHLSDIEKMSPKNIKRVLGFSVSTVEFMIHSSRLYIVQQISSYLKESRDFESFN